MFFQLSKFSAAQAKEWRQIGTKMGDTHRRRVHWFYGECKQFACCSYFGAFKCILTYEVSESILYGIFCTATKQGVTWLASNRRGRLVVVCRPVITLRRLSTPPQARHGWCPNCFASSAISVTFCHLMILSSCVPIFILSQKLLKLDSLGTRLPKRKQSPDRLRLTMEDITKYIWIWRLTCQPSMPRTWHAFHSLICHIAISLRYFLSFERYVQKLYDRSISVCVISLAPTGSCLGLPFVKPPRSSHVRRKRSACNIASQTIVHFRIILCSMSMPSSRR